MRFYDPATSPPDQLDSLELFPELPPQEGAKKCLKLGLLPSVTSVLSVIREEYLERWKMAEAIKNFQRHSNPWLAVDELFDNDSKESSFGTMVHDAVHHYVTGQPWIIKRDGINKDEAAEKAWHHALPGIQWLKENTKKILESETTIACKKTGAAGTLDLVVLTNENRLTIVDIKVVKIRKKYPPKPSVAYRAQLSAYAEMRRVLTGENHDRLSLYLASPFGDETKPKCLIFGYKNDYLPTFQACLEIWHAQYGRNYEVVENSSLSPKKFLGISTEEPRKRNMEPKA